VLMALAYQMSGGAGLVALKALIVGTTWAVVYGAVRTLHPVAAGVSLLLAAWAALPVTLTMRPQLWTLLLLIVLIRLLQAQRQNWVPLLFPLWANLHGGWVMGFAVLAIWCATTVIEAWWRTRTVRWTVLRIPLLALVGTLLNPYGWGLWRFLLETVSFTRSDITEWQPLIGTPAYTWVPLALTTSLVVAVCVNPRTRLSWAWLVVCCALGFASVRIARVAWIAMPALIMIAAPSIAIWWPRTRWTFAAPTRLAATLTLIPLVVIGGITLSLVRPAFACVPINGSWRPDAGAIVVLQRNRAAGRVVTWFDWGEYAYWHLGPKLRVSMDGRRETLYSDQVLATHRAIYDNAAAGHEWLAAQQPEYVWLPLRYRALGEWLAAHGYRIDWQSDQSYIAVRSDLMPLMNTGPSRTSGCFPGP